MHVSKQGKCCLLSVALLLMQFAAHGTQPTHSLIIVTPNQCVALNRGQMCFQEVTLIWESTQVGDYCVYSEQKVKALRCWQGQQNGKITLDVQATKSVEFSLQQLEPNETLATTLMRVAWVYKQKRQQIASWRLF